jgi:hypothetical protein
MMRPCRRAGITLFEVMIAVALAACLLAAGWSWVFTVSASSRADVAVMEASSRMAFARRELTADVSCGRLSAASPGCGSDGLSLVVTHPGGAKELVTIHYDPTRQVVWRKTSSCHVVQGVLRFGVEYLDSGGEALSPAAGGRPTQAELDRVVCLRFCVQLAQGRPVPSTWLVPVQLW